MVHGFGESSIGINTSIVQYGDPWDLGFHQHERVEISAILDGSGMFQYNEEIYPLETGDIVLIPSNLRHRFWSVKPIRFGVLHVGNMTVECKNMFYRLTSDNQPKIFHLTLLDLEMYESMFRYWLRVNSQTLREREKYISTWIHLFFLILHQYSTTGNRTLSIERAARHIRDNLKSVIRIYDLAKLSGVSESSFRRLFHSAYGVSPKQYQQNCRLEEAKWMLQSSERPIKTISEYIGFFSIHAFSSWFQKQTGMSPKEWRKFEQANQGE